MKRGTQISIFPLKGFACHVHIVYIILRYNAIIAFSSESDNELRPSLFVSGQIQSGDR